MLGNREDFSETLRKFFAGASLLAFLHERLYSERNGWFWELFHDECKRSASLFRSA
jgi:hypothetical protein